MLDNMNFPEVCYNNYKQDCPVRLQDSLDYISALSSMFNFDWPIKFVIVIINIQEN